MLNNSLYLILPKNTSEIETKRQEILEEHSALHICQRLLPKAFDKYVMRNAPEAFPGVFLVILQLFCNVLRYKLLLVIVLFIIMNLKTVLELFTVNVTIKNRSTRVGANARIKLRWQLIVGAVMLSWRESAFASSRILHG